MVGWLVGHWWLDGWSAVHAATFAAGALLLRRGYRTTVLWALVIGLAWEVVEMAVIERLAGFHEPWWNRWISDPLMDVLGAILGVALSRRPFP